MQQPDKKSQQFFCLLTETGGEPQTKPLSDFVLGLGSAQGAFVSGVIDADGNVTYTDGTTATASTWDEFRNLKSGSYAIPASYGMTS